MAQIGARRSPPTASTSTPHDEPYRSALCRDGHELADVEGLADLYRWCDRLVDELGCPDSAHAKAMSPAASGANTHEPPRVAFLDEWTTLVEATVGRLQCQGTIASTRAPANVATALLAGIQGGMLIARVTRDAEILRDAIRFPLDQLDRSVP